MTEQSISTIEIKATRILLNLHAQLLNGIMFKIDNIVQYKQDKPEEIMAVLENISNPERWEYCGIINDKDKVVIEVLEYLLNDDQKEIHKYKRKSFNKTEYK